MLWLALHLPMLSLETFCASLPAADASDGLGAVSVAEQVAKQGADQANQGDQATGQNNANVDRPVALVHQHRIHSVNPAAAQRGIQRGLKRATALALAADLLLADSDPQRDAQALLAVAHAALAFTPAVCLQGHHTVLLEVQASLRLFGGLPALHRRLQQALAPLGHQVQMAAAPTAWGAALLAQLARPKPHPEPAPPSPTAAAPASATAAKTASVTASVTASATAAATAAATASPARWVLGRHATHLPTLQALLGQAPLALLEAAQPHAEVLQGMGLHTLADLHGLPRDGLARRFGQGLLDELDRAWGLQNDPRKWLTAPAQFDSRLELFARADTTDQVLYGAAVLLARLVAWAQARQARVGAFTLRMLHERGRRERGYDAAHGEGRNGGGATDRSEHRSATRPLVPHEGRDTPDATELRIELAEPALDAKHLHLLLRERLARSTLAAPTMALHLHCQHLVSAPAPNGELFPTPGSRAEGLLRLLERLCARLGPEQVLRVLPVADHRPERASRAVPAQGAGTSAAHPASAKTPTGAGRPSAAVGNATQATTTPTAPPAVSPHHDAQPLHRPVWLLPQPLPLAERDALPLLQGQVLQLLSGPERIEAGWWDNEPVARDYFIAMAQDQCLVWVFRDRLPTAAGDVHWYMQGRFG
jgi:protein ImuB